MKNKALFVITLILIISNLYSYGGRLRPPKNIVKLYAVDKKYRTISFIRFENKTGNSSYDYLSESIPKNIIKTIPDDIRIKIPHNELQLSFINYHLLITQKLTNNQSNKTSFLSNYQINISSNLFIYAATNSHKDFQVVEFYFKNNNYNYISPLFTDFDITQLTNNEQIISYHRIKDHEEFIILNEDMDFKRRLNIEKSIFIVSNLMLNNLKNKINSDYIVYGDISYDAKKSIQIRMYLYKKFDNSFSCIFEESVDPDQLFNTITILRYYILGAIEKKSIIANIAFTSEPDNAFIYIDNIFAGKTPFILKSFPEGSHDLRIWKDEYKIKTENKINNYKIGDKFTNNNIIYRVEKNCCLPEKLIIYNKMIRSNHFQLEKEKSDSELNLTIINTNADIYINSTLYASEKNILQTKLPTGNYFLKIQKTNFQERYLRLTIKENYNTDISLPLVPVKNISKFSEIIHQPKRNIRLFMTMGVILSSASLYYRLRTDEYLEKQLITAKDYPEAIGSTESYYYYQEKYKGPENNLWHQIAGTGEISQVLFVSSLGFFSFAGYSYYQDKHRDEITIITDKKKPKNIKIEYKLNREF